MQTREQLRSDIVCMQNRHVYGFTYDEEFQIAQPLYFLTEKHVATDVEIAFSSQAGNIERASAGIMSAGDFVRCLDGTLERIASILERQTGETTTYQPGGNKIGGGYYLNDNTMYLSAGSLDSPVERTLQPTGETLPARVWFFSERYAGGGRGVYCNVACPVWLEV